MAKGNLFTVHESVAQNGFMDVKPPNSNTEWKLHNVNSDGAFELYGTQTTPSLTTLMDSSSDGKLYNLTLGSTFGNYLRVKNVSGVTQTIRADGMVTTG